MTARIRIYDTTLRDGTQGEGVAFSVEDKLLIARKLDELGVDYIEGGWPGSNVKDAGFFSRARSLKLEHARLAAFGSTCHPRNSPEQDPNLRKLVEAETPVVTVFGKSWDLHVKKALRISLQENVDLIGASIAYLKSMGREVIYDAEHFFDGYAANPSFAVETLKAADDAGADTIVLCDTNGGTLTSRLVEIVDHVRKAIRAPVGIHAHNDSDMAVANSVAAVEHGVSQVQGTINGYGERCGNANLCSIIPVLELKLGRETIGRERLGMLTSVSHYVAELANLPHRTDLPFVGRSAFAHKGGVHVSAVMRDPVTYEHVDPELTGNSRRVLVSDLSGKSNVLYKAAEMGIDISGSEPGLKDIVDRIKELEHNGFQFEAAEGSFRLLLEEGTGRLKDFFTLDSYTVETDRDSEAGISSKATVRLVLNGRVKKAFGEGCGPVNALDRALRQALSDSFPCLKDVRLVDYKVRVLDADNATAARVRVLIQTRDDEETWSTVGVSENILEASWQALADAVNYKLQKAHRHAGEPEESFAKQRVV
jgi:2-isopropylmalate synthase